MKTVTIHRAEWMKIKEQAAQVEQLLAAVRAIAASTSDPSARDTAKLVLAKTGGYP